jgi:hypothetical protein
MTPRLPLAWDLLRGAVVGLLLCYAVARLVGLDAEALVFRYAGY